MATVDDGLRAGASPQPAALPVALDVMGGDHAPGPALAAARQLVRTGVPILLCGPSVLVGGLGAAHLDAPDVIAMDEDPAFAVRDRVGASVVVAARAVAEGRAGAMVSAGSTGAVVAAAILHLGRLPGVRRVALAARIPTAAGHVLLLDVGAAPDADAATLAAHARMGQDHARTLGVAAPTVGLLNVGVEANRGPRRVRAAAALLAELPGFAGGVEPAAILAGAVDVVVADGFAGNVLLKALEAALAPGRPRDATALVLGVAGTVLVGHGAATSAELVVAVRTAAGLAHRPLVAATGGKPPRQSETSRT